MNYGFSRRDLLVSTCRLAAAGIVGAPLSALLSGVANASSDPALDEILRTAPKARFFDPLSSGTVRCTLCANRCVVALGGRGRCRARMNVDGGLRALSFGRHVAVHVDPIEKKPFFHFLPGVQAYSIGTTGCPLRCRFCQNWQISQSTPEQLPSAFTPPSAVVSAAGAAKAPVIAFTYNEPTVQFEFLAEVVPLARKAGIRSVIVSSGIMNEEPLREMCGFLSAVKIDLKGFSPEFYRDVCEADLSAVLRSVRQVAKSGVHLEIVNLVVPTLNDSEKMLNGLAEWVVGEIGPDVPLHFTRFHPDYQLRNLPPTPVRTLERAREIAMSKGIRYAYVGNVPGHPGNNTFCPGCGKVVIARSNFFVTEMQMDNGRCRSCRRQIAGVWS